MQTIYESSDFYNDFYLFGILGLIFILFALFGWRIIIDDEEFRKKGFPLRLMFLFFGVLMLYLAFPYAKDIPSVQKKQYAITTGELTDVWITESSDADEKLNRNASGPSYITHFTIDDTYFSLENGHYIKLVQLMDVELQVSYLPYSRKVMQIDIPLTKENIEKVNALNENK